jgi:hypothetical protein
MLQIRAEMHESFHLKCILFSSDSNQNSNRLANVCEVASSEMAKKKTVQHFPSYYIRNNQDRYKDTDWFLQVSLQMRWKPTGLQKGNALAM